MRNADLGQLRDLAKLQEVLTGDATAELAEARDAENAADSAAQHAARRAEDMAEHWYGHLSGPVMPERWVAIAALLVERECDASQSEEQARRSRDHAGDRERLWRAANASQRATGKVVGALKRKQARKAEEQALAALADQTTVDWMIK